MAHLKTLTVPITWPIKRKGVTFVIRPKPGKSFAMSMPLALIFKNVLKYCKTSKEVRTILQDKEILVDARRRKSPKYLVGFMDVLSIPLTKEYYRMIISKTQKLKLIAITVDESKLKVAKIIGKTVLKKGKIQLNFFDGRNIIVKENKFKVGDSVSVTLPNQEIKEVFELKKGNCAFLTGGKHVGEHGVIESITKDKQGLITIKTKEGTFDTPKQFVFVIGKEKPALKVE